MIHCDGWHRNRKVARLWEEEGMCLCGSVSVTDVGGVSVLSIVAQERVVD